MKSFFSLLLFALLVIACVLATATWHIYKYNDCIKVGHTKTYCIFDNGN